MKRILKSFFEIFLTNVLLTLDFFTFEFLFLRKLPLSAAPRKVPRIEEGSLSPIPPLVLSEIRNKQIGASLNKSMRHFLHEDI